LIYLAARWRDIQAKSDEKEGKKKKDGARTYSRCDKLSRVRVSINAGCSRRKEKKRKKKDAMPKEKRRPPA